MESAIVKAIYNAINEYEQSQLEKITTLENKVAQLVRERELIINALKRNDIFLLKEYFHI